MEPKSPKRKRLSTEQGFGEKEEPKLAWLRIRKRLQRTHRQRVWGGATLALSLLFLCWSGTLWWVWGFPWDERQVQTPEKDVPGYVLLRLSPASARIEVDGKRLAVGTRGVSLKVGKHILRASAFGFRPETRAFEVHAEDARLLRVRLKPLPVPISIVSEPTGALAFFNDRPMGQTPFERSQQPRWLRVRLEKHGYVASHTDIQIKSGQRSTQRFVLRLGGFARRRMRDQATMRWIAGRYFQRGLSVAGLRRTMLMCAAERGRPCRGSWFFAEQPQRLVWLDGFWLDQQEVSNRAYRACVLAGTCTPPAFKRGLQSPVAGVSWDQARKYCRWAGARLPSEAEWELGVGGGRGTAFPWGREWKAGFSNLGRFLAKRGAAADPSDGFRQEAPVGALSRGQSRYGIQNGVGNLAEWTADCFHSSFYRVSPEENPVHRKKVCAQYAVRGGSWMSARWEGRVTFRQGVNANTRSLTIGFRCAKTASAKQPKAAKVAP